MRDRHIAGHQLFLISIKWDWQKTQLLWLSVTFQCHIQSMFNVWDGGGQGFVHTVSCHRHVASVLWMRTEPKSHNETLCDCTFRETGEDILHILSAVWDISMKGGTAFRKRSWITLCGKRLLQTPLKHSVVTHPKHLHQRDRDGWMHVCVWVRVCWCVIMSVCWGGWRGESCQCCPTQRR